MSVTTAAIRIGALRTACVTGVCWITGGCVSTKMKLPVATAQFPAASRAEMRNVYVPGRVYEMTRKYRPAPASKAAVAFERGAPPGALIWIHTSATAPLSVTLALTFTVPPISCGDGTAVADAIEGGVTSAVVNVEVNGPAIGVPGSLASLAVAFTRTRYTMPWASGPEGVNARSFPAQANVPATYVLV